MSPFSPIYRENVPTVDHTGRPFHGIEDSFLEVSVQPERGLVTVAIFDALPRSSGLAAVVVLHARQLDRLRHALDTAAGQVTEPVLPDCENPSRTRYVAGCRCGGCKAAEASYKRLYRLRQSLDAQASPADTWQALEDMGGEP